VFLLDTNAVIAVLNERAPEVAVRLDEEVGRGTTILLSAIVLYELRYGIAKSGRAKRNEAVLTRFLAGPVTLIDFDAKDAEYAGDIRAHLGRQGTPIGPYDVLIAAQARRRSATLVTANGREFGRVPGLAHEDWMAPA